MAAVRTTRRTADPLVGRPVAGQPAAAAGVLAEPDHAARAGPGPDGGRGARPGGRAARPGGWHRLPPSFFCSAGHTPAGARPAGGGLVAGAEPRARLGLLAQSPLVRRSAVACRSPRRA